MITLVDYGAGNLMSVARALRHIGEECAITRKHDAICSSERVIFPGVGAAGEAMEVIRREGLDTAIRRVVAAGVPFLGICLGAQIVLEESEEDGGTPCLGIIPGMAKRFQGTAIKIPHMGWNNLSVRAAHPVLAGVDARAQFYFVHSYYPAPVREEDIIATTDYGISFASIIGRGNVIATQFHIEKSGEHGLRVLKNFCNWNGSVALC